MEGLIQGRYRILHEIGQGGMAVVYKGVDTALDRDVAVKVLHPHLASRADSRMRLQREAKAVAKLHHPNILEIYDYSGPDSDRSFIVTEYIRGETLKECFERHQPTLPEIGAMVVHEIAGAVAHAHDAGIIHRDIKPENIMIRDDGVLKLMDFGIAQITDLQAMTVTGALVGSPAHMSPEHVEGKALDWRSDIFSLGTLLYALCAGRLPFESPSPHALLRQILETRFDDPRIHNPAISRRLYAIIGRCLRRDPEERFDTARELQEELAAYLREVGLVDPGAELRDYFEDPPAGEEALKGRVVERLMELARSEAAEGRVASSLERYNQVLALEGDRQDAMAELNRLSSSHSRATLARRVGAGVLVAASIAAVLWAAGAFTTGQPVDEPARSQATLSALPSTGGPKAVAVVAPPAGAGGADHAAAAAPGPAADPRGPSSVPPDTDVHAPTDTAPPAAPYEPAVARKFMVEAAGGQRRGLELYAIAPAMDVAPPPHEVPKPRPPDGRRLPPNKPAGPAVVVGEPTGVTFRLAANHGGSLSFQGATYDDGKTPPLTLPPGTYTARVWKPGCDSCFEVTESITVFKGMPPTRRVMYGLRPCNLLVSGPAGARVHVGEHHGTTGQPIELSMNGDPRRRVQVRVELAGYDDASFMVQLAPGALVTRTAALTPRSP